NTLDDKINPFSGGKFLYFVTIPLTGGSELNAINGPRLKWTVVKKDEGDGQNPVYYLVVNKDRPSSVEWTVEGFVGVEFWNGQFNERKACKFSFNNGSRVGRLPTYHNLGNILVFITTITGIWSNVPFDLSPELDD
ncbi:hypothetical protein PMAYCL1PPCAC_24845, partial [Pristionchus mayeri]